MFLHFLAFITASHAKYGLLAEIPLLSAKSVIWSLPYIPAMLFAVVFFMALPWMVRNFTNQRYFIA